MTTPLLHPLIRILVPVCCFAACADGAEPPRPVEPQGQVGTVTATIENRLPADGCSFVVHIDSVAYAPDAATLAAIRVRSFDFGETAVEVEYTPTGRTGTVECGYSADHTELRALPEVALVFQDS